MPYLVLPVSPYWLLAPFGLVVLVWMKVSLQYGYPAAIHSVHNMLVITAASLLMLLAASVLVAIQYQII